MKHRLRLLCALLGVTAAAMAGALTAPAAFAGESPVTVDCNAHGALTHHYSITQLRSALASLPAQVKEYTDCYDVINRQLLAELGTGGKGGAGGGGSGGSFLPTPVIVIVVVLALAAVTFGAVELRRRRAGDVDRDQDQDRD